MKIKPYREKKINKKIYFSFGNETDFFFWEALPNSLLQFTKYSEKFAAKSTNLQFI